MLRALLKEIINDLKNTIIFMGQLLIKLRRKIKIEENKQLKLLIVHIKITKLFVEQRMYSWSVVTRHYFTDQSKILRLCERCQEHEEIAYPGQSGRHKTQRQICNKMVRPINKNDQENILYSRRRGSREKKKRKHSGYNGKGYYSEERSLLHHCAFIVFLV